MQETMPAHHETRIKEFMAVPQAAVEPRPPRPPGFWVTNHETRLFIETRPFRHESRVFVEPPQARPTGFHETRNTRHETRPFLGLTECRFRATAALPPGVFHETRNTAYARARRKPARIPRFSRNTRHESRLFLGLFSALSRVPALLPCSQLPGIAHYCPAPPGPHSKRPRPQRQAAAGSEAS